MAAAGNGGMSEAETLARRVLAALVETAHVERLDPSGAAVVSIAVSPEMLDDFATLGAGLEDMEDDDPDDEHDGREEEHCVASFSAAPCVGRASRKRPH